jgi:drug/metabolite transporter (DMT)-like permease
LLLALGVFARAIPFTSFLIAAVLNRAARLGVAAYFVPVVAVTLAVVFLGENLTPAVVVGAVLIISGVIVTERSSRHVPVPGVDIAE